MIPPCHALLVQYPRILPCCTLPTQDSNLPIPCSRLIPPCHVCPLPTPSLCHVPPLQRQAEDVVTVASKFKQRYECRLPPAAIRRQPNPEEEAQLYNGSGVAELLRPMGAAPCLVKTKDWWTYEFCYGKHIQQYHMEESEIKGDILFLGYYQSAFDWDDETAKASKQHRLKRYHSQSYVNGSRCDLTGRAREAEVRFLCEEGAGDYIARVDEPQSCSYVLTVHTTRICHHPFLRPPAGAAPQPILCQPALSPAQYVEYVRAQVSDTKRKVEEISEELKTLDTRLWSERDAETPAQPPEGTPVAHGEAVPGDEPDPAKEAAFWERVREVTEKAGSQQDSTRAEDPSPKATSGQAADTRKKIHFKVIRSPGDLLQFIEELKESTKKAKEKASEEEEEAAAVVKAPPDPPVPEEPPAGERERLEEEEEDEEEDGDLLGGFEKELEAVLLPREQMAQLKEEVKTEMEKEFDNIINEVEDELETEGLKGEFDRNQASKSLASTLNRLMDKLDGGGPSPGGEKEEEEGTGRKASPSPPADGRVRVRVSRIGPSNTHQRDPPRREMARDNPQLHHIESEVRELLAKEGLRAEGEDAGEARALYERVRILCWVMTGPGTLETKARHVRATWARHCNVALFMSSEPDERFPAIGLPVREGRHQLYWKTIRAFQYVYRHHLDRADWFLKADDDTFVVVANLRWLLAGHPPDRPIYFGKRFKPFAKQGYMSGGAGYVLSKEALRRFVTAFASGTCTHTSAVEDLAMGQCLEKVGVEAGDSRDTWGRETFHPFPPESHLTDKFSQSFWYRSYCYYPIVESIKNTNRGAAVAGDAGAEPGPTGTRSPG
ncbi:PREDICTED: protein OS-9 [Haliaeetus leucocephalus]|uniref:protein OS-9 n=1 Tax=Haliaeetus leucocephalus TaxID=52644 RepID=UPI00053CD8F3|nr:PREDICTED: protein OS-9 [Haliaeetus leucocephalus]